MFIELIDRLRCPHDHDESWLVAAVTRAEDGRLAHATLGCPVCDAEFAVRDGAVIFGPAAASVAMPADADDTMRAAALLDLQENGLYVLDAGWGSLAVALLAVMPVAFLVVDPPPGVRAQDGIGVLVGTGDGWPLAPASLQGMALARATPARLAAAVRVLTPRGRLVAPVEAPVPLGMHELARDTRHWVAEKVSDVVTLGRAVRR